MKKYKLKKEIMPDSISSLFIHEEFYNVYPILITGIAIIKEANIP